MSPENGPGQGRAVRTLRFPEGNGRPRALQTIVVRTPACDGTWSEVLRRWTADDAAGCRRCPAALCTFVAAGDGQGICVRRYAGDVDDAAAEDLGMPAATAPPARPGSPSTAAAPGLRSRGRPAGA